MLYLALRIAHEIIKESRRHRRKKKPTERCHCSVGASTASVFVTTGGGSNGSWTNARG